MAPPLVARPRKLPPERFSRLTKSRVKLLEPIVHCVGDSVREEGSRLFRPRTDAEVVRVIVDRHPVAVLDLLDELSPLVDHAIERIPRVPTSPPECLDRAVNRGVILGCRGVVRH